MYMMRGSIQEDLVSVYDIENNTPNTSNLTGSQLVVMNNISNSHCVRYNKCYNGLMILLAFGTIGIYIVLSSLHH